MGTELPVMGSALPVRGTSEDAFLCVRCAQHMKTCCQTSEVYTTPGDVRRISEFTGQEDFTEFRQVEDPIYLDQDDDPIWNEHVFRADGSRRVLKRKPGGDCTFLGDQGCVLPLETRPLICRIYPYDFTAEGLLERLAKGCPTQLIPTGKTLLQALDIDRSDAQRWHKQLYEEILTEQDAS